MRKSSKTHNNQTRLLRSSLYTRRLLDRNRRLPTDHSSRPAAATTAKSYAPCPVDAPGVSGFTRKTPMSETPAGNDLWTGWFCLVLHLLGCAKKPSEPGAPQLYMCASALGRCVASHSRTGEHALTISLSLGCACVCSRRYYDTTEELVRRQLQFRRLRKTARDASNSSLSSLGVLSEVEEEVGEDMDDCLR